MKKVILSLFIGATSLFASAQCTIDMSNTAFFSPDTFPCVERSVAYNQTLQISVPANTANMGLPIPITLTIDTIIISNITGFPAGLSYTANPTSGVFPGGTNGCFQITGTTTAPAGNYPLSLSGSVSLSSLFPPIDTTVDLALIQSMAAGMFNLSLDVIEQGAPCRVNGINDLAFNAKIAAYPNPAKDNITVSINSAERINGTIEVINVLGAKVYSNKIDIFGTANYDINTSALPRGIYTVLLTDNNRKYSSNFVKE